MAAPLSNSTPALKVYRELIFQVENAINQEHINEKPNEVSNSLGKIQDLLTQLFEFWNENQTILTQTVSSKDFEILKHFQDTLYAYSLHLEDSKALKALILEVIKQSNQVSNYVYLIPKDTLILIFQKFITLPELVTWGSICRRTKGVFLQTANWSNSEVFKLLIHDPKQEVSQQQFMRVLVGFGDTLHTNAFARELATLFFNQASDEVLAQFFSKGKKECIESYLRLLIPEQLNRSTLMLWPNYFDHREVFPIDIYLPNIKELNALYVHSLDDKNILALLQNKKYLKSLILKTPQSGKFIKAIELCKETLEILKVQEANNLSKTELSDLAGFTCLRHLKLSKNRLKDNECEFLEGMSYLESLDFSYSKSVDGSFLNYLESTGANLKELNLQGCTSIDSKGLLALPSCPKLEKFVLTGSAINDEAVGFTVGKTPSVQVLILDDCRKLTGAVLSQISECRNLQELSCNLWKEIKDFQLEALIIMPKLEILRLIGVSELTGSGFKELEAPLKEINLSKCNQIESQNLNHLKRFSRTLERLSLSHLECSIDQLGFLGGMERLHLLDLQGCSKLQQSALETLISAEAKTPLKKSLQALNLSFTPLGDSIQEVISRLEDLHKLYVRFCPNLTDKFLEGNERLTTLTTLDLVGVPGVTQSAIKALSLKAPNMQITHNSRT